MSERTHEADTVPPSPLSISPNSPQTNTQLVHVGMRPKRVTLDNTLLNSSDPKIKLEIIRILAQYLQDEGYTTSRAVLLDEANVKIHENSSNLAIKKIRQAVAEGNWEDVAACSAQVLKQSPSNNGFLYAVYRQQFLEMIDRNEIQQAFNCMTKRIKPLEKCAQPDELRDLCYMLTCKSVQDVPAFRNWEGIDARKKILEEFTALVDFSVQLAQESSRVPPARLLELLRQACAYQVEFTRYQPSVQPKIDSLLKDFTSLSLPTAVRHCLSGHTQNVKCVDFVGADGLTIASGSSDMTVRVWDTETGTQRRNLIGHTSRIWDLASTSDASVLCSASADSTLRFWNLAASESNSSTQSVIRAHEGDVYTVQWHPAGNHVVSGGYDQTVRLFDARTSTEIRKFVGHTASVSQVVMNAQGTLIITGSKDHSIRFWDVTSGLCVRTVVSSEAEITSVELHSDGDRLIAATKCNSNDLFDLRNVTKAIRRFRGHQNISKNFIRAKFGPLSNLVMSGSEDGLIYMWDINTGKIAHKLEGHEGAVYRTAWNNSQSLLISCSDDQTARTWYDPPFTAHH